MDVKNVRQCWSSIAVAYISYIHVSPTTHNPILTPDTMSSSILNTLPPPSSDPFEASIQRFGANPFDPDIIVQPRLRLSQKTRRRLQHEVKRGSCRPSREDDFKQFHKVFEDLTKSKRKELWADLDSPKGTAESQTIQQELTRYCKESGLSIIACFTLPDYIRLVKERPDWVTVHGAKRESFARHLSNLSIAPEETYIQGYRQDPGLVHEKSAKTEEAHRHSSDTPTAEPSVAEDASRGDYHFHCGRYTDSEKRGTCTVSDREEVGSSDGEEGEDSIQTKRRLSGTIERSRARNFGARDAHGASEVEE